MNLAALLLTLTTYMTTYFGTVKGSLSTLVTRFNAHAFDRTNPHGVNKDQVGLSEVQNYPPATLQQATDGIDNQSNMTPRRTSQLLEANLVTPMIATLDQAIADLS